jgi:hypothetical protein
MLCLKDSVQNSLLYDSSNWIPFLLINGGFWLMNVLIIDIFSCKVFPFFDQYNSGFKQMKKFFNKTQTNCMYTAWPLSSLNFLVTAIAIAGLRERSLITMAFACIVYLVKLSVCGFEIIFL